jgi:starch phosphorylase
MNDARPVEHGSARPLAQIGAVELRAEIARHLAQSLARTPQDATLTDWRMALSLAIRDRVVQPWLDSDARARAEGRKRVYYLSMEFLIGRLLEDAVSNLGLDGVAREAVAQLGLDYDAVVGDEPDAALGNGGLGRLAACFLESMSSIGLAGTGYGIRYEHGLFRQGFDDGWQAEEAEDWLRQPQPWEFARDGGALSIGFGGHVADGPEGARVWHPGETVLAEPHDTPVVGWGGAWINTLRLWAARPEREFELEPFNRGDFVGAAVPAVLAQTISRVLYPDDTTPQGKELRLKQEYFFTAASIADILARFDAEHGELARLPDHVAIQLNDTHPAIAGPELIRVLVDERGLSFEAALGIAQATLNYTNHTLLPEALEVWSEELMGRVLPRHLEIIRQMDAHLGGWEDGPRLLADGHVHMGPLSFVTARRVNGVSALHTELMKSSVFARLHGLHPDRIVNQTNGVTPRRWIHGCNPALAVLLDEAAGPGWVTDLEALEALEPLAEDAVFRARYAAAKHDNKRRMAAWAEGATGLVIDPDAMFDVQIKRMHEYKRQLLNVLETIALWTEMRRDPDRDWPARVKIFGGKAAPGYFMAKLIVKLINDVAATVNADAEMRGRLKVLFPPNYNVTMAERLIPAADLSEQISTAGKEASGTGNMKLALNGALTIGTLDGANVEIADAVGREHIFIFGMTADEVAARREGYDPAAEIARSARLADAVVQIETGRFSPEQPDRFLGIVQMLREHDPFLVAADFDAYWDAQRAVDAAWADAQGWTRSAILNTARCGFFSSDRTIRGYAADIWGAEPRL